VKFAGPVELSTARGEQSHWPGIAQRNLARAKPVVATRLAGDQLPVGDIGDAELVYTLRKRNYLDCARTVMGDAAAHAINGWRRGSNWYRFPGPAPAIRGGGPWKEQAPAVLESGEGPALWQWTETFDSSWPRQLMPVPTMWETELLFKHRRGPKANQERSEVDGIME